MKTAILIVLLSSPLLAVSYKQTGNPNIIQRVDDTAFIPVDPGNRDYMDFLHWQGIGGTILPADPVVITPNPEPSLASRIKALEAAVQAVATKTNTPIDLPAQVITP